MTKLKVVVMSTVIGPGHTEAVFLFHAREPKPSELMFGLNDMNKAQRTFDRDMWTLLSFGLKCEECFS